MNNISSTGLNNFKNEVGTKFQLYNSLFTSLPFLKIERTGILLSLLANNCEEGYKVGMSPIEIIDDFFTRHTQKSDLKSKADFLFRFIQYAERQVVLFDAIEDAAYKQINDLSGAGTMKQLIAEVQQSNKDEELIAILKDFCVRLVLTAHPTQFYPGEVLGIIHDLSKALLKNDTGEVNLLLQQLGKTPFFKQQKPTPYDEATSLIWFLENVFYPSVGRITGLLKRSFPELKHDQKPVLQMGFWPGGDRDGNPFVTSDTTIKVANALHSSILKCYYLDIRKLKRRLTFKGVTDLIAGLESKLYHYVFLQQDDQLSIDELKSTLNEVKRIINAHHNGLFVQQVDNLLNKIQVFGFNFATLDIRQDSSIHNLIFEKIAEENINILPSNYQSLSEEEKVKCLLALHPQRIQADIFTNDVQKDTFLVPNAIKVIQDTNGLKACDRYIISHCESVLNVMEVFSLFTLNGFQPQDIHVDIIPLFETIEDLRNAASIMQKLYNIETYKTHLNRRGKTQTIMLGFSDGTKDGGYLMGNWSIYKAKKELSKITKMYGFEVVFFDGRGGPPSRGGGKTHKFYASMGKHISNKEIQLTIQGQTISSNFGVIDSAQYNLEQLLNAGISNQLFEQRQYTLTSKDEELIEELSSYGLDAYKGLRDHQHLIDYLVEISPLKYYSDTNIGSRPAKRGTKSTITLNDLRAIPFSGAWSQLKQNVPGFYGVGTALKRMEEIGKLQELEHLYHQSLFVKTLLDNCEMAMCKSYFAITKYVVDEDKFADVWNMIYNEFILTKEMLLKLTGKKELMEDYPIDALSIQMREKIVLPLVTIQQYAIAALRNVDENSISDDDRTIYEKLIMRCSFGLINAGRNSA
ncbi:MAG: phosphoenolpyruvate carboxylase [Chitinophagaceae bacterium]|nr:MAG: phosphoenolpyruvate carboxylase [Chitinophagaceae bacterium]